MSGPEAAVPLPAERVLLSLSRDPALSGSTLAGMAARLDDLAPAGTRDDLREAAALRLLDEGGLR